MIHIKGKKGDKLISVYWFAILFIVAAAIVYIVAIFYGKPYDVRGLEADMLADKVADCFSNAGYIRGDWESITNDNFLQTCGLNFNVEDFKGWDDDQYYIEFKINVFGLDNSKPLLDIFEGNINFRDSCQLEGENSVVCLDRDLYVIDEENNQYKLNILSVVGKVEKNDA